MHFILSFLLLNSTFLNGSTEKPFVLVELFTSEGCSSCPPADRLLSEIVDKEYNDVDVIGLSFHVDYWDYIGWKDPYADQIFTKRQRTYARKFYSNQVYTPQMVVNGKFEFVGSSRSKWENILGKLSAKEPKYSIDIQEWEIVNDELLIRVSSKNDNSVILNVALVERGLSQNVTRGENRGRLLSHDNVVRSFKTRQFDGQLNELRLQIPDDVKISNASLVVYAQNERSWEIIDAFKTPLVD